jgi:hypothetical protein
VATITTSRKNEASASGLEFLRVRAKVPVVYPLRRKSIHTVFSVRRHSDEFMGFPWQPPVEVLCNHSFRKQHQFRKHCPRGVDGVNAKGNLSQYWARAVHGISAAVEHVYPLDQFKEAFKQSLKSNRSGKILFQFEATDVAGISK